MNKLPFEVWLSRRLSERPKRKKTIVNEDTMDREYQEEKDNSESFGN